MFRFMHQETNELTTFVDKMWKPLKHTCENECLVILKYATRNKQWCESIWLHQEVYN